MNKATLRQELLARRLSLNWLEVQGKSHEITQQILFLSEYRKAKTLFLYLPFRQEPNTLPLIKTAQQQQKRIIVPICQPKDKSLLLSYITSSDNLTEGFYGIPEPKGEYFTPANKEDIDLAIIPGLAFDGQGNRLGYGAGYFDRFLSTLGTACTIAGIAYDFQVIDLLPVDEHDIPVDVIITESKIIYIKK